MGITYCGEKLPCEDELRGLYGSLGWTAYIDDMKSAVSGLCGSLAVYTAWADGKLIGMLRIIGDGHTVAYVQDLLVEPGFQNRGIGTELMRMFLNQYGHVRQKVLLTDVETPAAIRFYERLGFVATASVGCVAMIWMGGLADEAAQTDNS